MTAQRIEVTVRRARPGDLAAVRAVEEAAFQPHRRASPASLRRSLHSPMQSVWVAVREKKVLGILVLWHFPKALRVYDVAVRPDTQGLGIGHALMAKAHALARRSGAERIILEAQDESRLLRWYESQGYRRVRKREGFYAPGKHAWRMERGPPFT